MNVKLLTSFSPSWGFEFCKSNPLLMLTRYKKQHTKFQVCTLQTVKYKLRSFKFSTPIHLLRCKNSKMLS